MNISKHGSALMAFTLMTLIGGCATVQTSAICDATIKSRDDLTVALLDDAGPKSMMAGATLIGQMDEGCNT